MKGISTLVGFAAGCLAATAVVGLATDLRAQGADGTIPVCIGEDRVVRFAGAQPCAEGQRRYVLQEAEADEIEPPEAEPHQPDSASEADAARRLAEIDRRMRMLEGQAETGQLGNRVVAPFEVVDRGGRTIFRVEEHQVRVYNAAGKVAAQIVAGEDGGYFMGISATHPLMAAIGASGPQAGVRVAENDVNRVDLGRNETAGTYRLLIQGAAGQNIAGIGQGADGGAGLAYVYDEAGTLRASLNVTPEGKGQISVHNSSGAVVAGMTEGRTAGGLLEIMNSAGERMVAAGVQTGGFGVVQTGPGSFSPGYGLLGLPGSYIAGKPQ